MLCTLCGLLGVLLTLLLVLDQQELALLSLEQHPTSVPSRCVIAPPHPWKSCPHGRRGRL